VLGYSTRTTAFTFTAVRPSHLYIYNCEAVTPLHLQLWGRHTFTVNSVLSSSKHPTRQNGKKVVSYTFIFRFINCIKADDSFLNEIIWRFPKYVFICLWITNNWFLSGYYFVLPLLHVSTQYVSSSGNSSVPPELHANRMQWLIRLK
jgi:hypothetical protein